MEVVLDRAARDGLAQKLLDPRVDVSDPKLGTGFRKHLDDELAHRAERAPAIWLRPVSGLQLFPCFVPVATCETLEITGCK